MGEDYGGGHGSDVSCAEVGVLVLVAARDCFVSSSVRISPNLTCQLWNNLLGVAAFPIFKGVPEDKYCTSSDEGEENTRNPPLDTMEVIE